MSKKEECMGDGDEIHSEKPTRRLYNTGAYA